MGVGRTDGILEVLFPPTNAFLKGPPGGDLMGYVDVGVPAALCSCHGLCVACVAYAAANAHGTREVYEDPDVKCLLVVATPLLREKYFLWLMLNQSDESLLH
jgi:hypothetical protein